jgi:2-polyprenyl-6-methoxyphenol hydroxylase-like FAD-dependent oxidoreductase
VLGCDGSRSVVRTQAGIGFPGKPVLANLPRPHTGSASWLHPEGMFVTIPLPDSGPAPVWRLMADVPSNGADEPNQEALVAQLRHAATVWTDLARAPHPRGAIGPRPSGSAVGWRRTTGVTGC